MEAWHVVDIEQSTTHLLWKECHRNTSVCIHEQRSSDMQLKSQKVIHSQENICVVVIASARKREGEGKERGEGEGRARRESKERRS